MNRGRVLINVLISLAAAAGGIALLLSDRWTWSSGEGELVFTGASLWLLGVGLLFLAGFMASIARAWALGEVELPPGNAACAPSGGAGLGSERRPPCPDPPPAPSCRRTSSNAHGPWAPRWPCSRWAP